MLHTTNSLKEQCQSKHLEKTSHYFQFFWLAIRVNRPHALPSMYDFDFVGLGCGINFSLV